jgi:hypothetical protein
MWVFTPGQASQVGQAGVPSFGSYQAPRVATPLDNATVPDVMPGGPLVGIPPGGNVNMATPTPTATTPTTCKTPWWMIILAALLGGAAGAVGRGKYDEKKSGTGKK